MRLELITAALERVCPLRFQDDFDNSGLQVGLPAADVRSALVCLDVTEAVIDEAVARDCQLVVSHHPLLFHPLKCVGDGTYQQRCVTRAVKNDIAVYSAHTSLDNAPGGVNHKIAELIGLQDLEWLEPRADGESGSGLVGELPQAVGAGDFFARLKEIFRVPDLKHSGFEPGRKVKRIALCGGAGAFLMRRAMEAGADLFVTGEFHYHDWFESGGMLLAELGHYQSEQFTIDLISDLLRAGCPGLRVEKTALFTDPVKHL